MKKENKIEIDEKFLIILEEKITSLVGAVFDIEEDDPNKEELMKRLRLLKLRIWILDGLADYIRLITDKNK